MKIKKLFLVRHGEYLGANFGLTDNGKRQTKILAEKIKKHLNGEVVTIWSSLMVRATETAMILKNELQITEPIISKEKLWSNDSTTKKDFEWLFQEINNPSLSVEALIIVTHLEYFEEFPTLLGFPSNYCAYTEGVYIYEDKCIKIPNYPIRQIN